MVVIALVYGVTCVVGFYIELKRQLFRDNALYHRYLATKVSSSPTLLRCWGFARVAFL